MCVCVNKLNSMKMHFEAKISLLIAVDYTSRFL